MFMLTFTFTLAFTCVQVPYNITSWLDKNKDPINESVVNLLSESKEKLVAEIFPPADAGGALVL